MTTTIIITSDDDELLTKILAKMYRQNRKGRGKTSSRTRQILKVKGTIKKPKLKRTGTKLQGSHVLEGWLKRNLEDPYPTKGQMEYFKDTTGLTSVQINNWFSNARRRWPELKNGKSSRKRAK